jgi:methionine synthase II (cobalamin-independent)
MKRSTDRILTIHAGSLPRPPELLDLVQTGGAKALDQSSNAERIVRHAGGVGRENVIAGSDCGFATFAGLKEIHPSIVWAKFKSLSDGARIASKGLRG